MSLQTELHRMGVKILSISACLALALHAEEPQEIADLTQDLQNITKSAIATKQNIDYQPYILSVWSSDKLMAMGCLTLKDAMMILPGVDVSVDNIYNQIPIFRGSNPFAYGQSKLFIDGVLVNDRTFQSYSPYLDVPLEMIKRIEVIRGSGAFEADEGGYAGSIRVVTYAEDAAKAGGKAFAGAGGFNAKSFGTFYNGKAGDWNLHSELFVYSNSLQIHTNGNDAPLGNAAYASSGVVPINLSTHAFGLVASNGGFTLTARAIKYELGDAFGNLNAIPNPDSKQSGTPWHIEAKYIHDLSRDLNMEAKVGYMEDGWSSFAKTLPDGARLPTSGMPGNYTTFPNGYWGDLSITQRAYYAGTTFKYSGIESHAITAGAKYINEKNIDLKSITTDRTNTPTSNSAMVDYTNTYPFFDASAKRVTTKLYISDNYNISDKVALAFGGSSDKASDLAIQNDYHVSLVYQPNRDDIYKLLTNTSYRAPSWQEMYTMNNPARNGNSNLQAERVTSYEAQYIRKLSTEDSASINLFHLINTNQIALMPYSGGYHFQNAGGATINGGEIELRRNLTQYDFVYLGYSYAKGVIDSGASDGYDMPGTAEHMVKSSWVRDWGRGFSSGLMLMYIGEKARMMGDTRAKTPAYSTADLSVSYDAPRKIWGAQFGVKNIADATILYPSPVGGYPGDYPMGGRYLFFKIYTRF